MKINMDRAPAGFAPENNEKTGKTAQPSKNSANMTAQTAGIKDELELTNRKADVLNAVRQANVDAVSAEGAGAPQMDAIRQKLAALNEYIRENPMEALAAQANLSAESVTKLVG